VTGTPLSRSRGQRSKSPGRFGWLYWQANMDIELVTDPDACMMYNVSSLAGLGGDILWRPPAYSLLFRRVISHRCHHGKSHYTLYSSGITRDFLVHKTNNGNRNGYFDCLLVPFHNLCNSETRDEQTTSERHRFPGEGPSSVEILGKKD